MEIETDHEIDSLADKVNEVAEELKEVEKDTDELKEERKKQAQERSWLNQVALSTGIFSALAAIAAMHGNYLDTEGMLAKLEANDQWSYYQAKSTKRLIYDSNKMLLESLDKPVPSTIVAETNRLDQEKAAIQVKANQLTAESYLYIERHERFASSVTALQVAISLGAVAALLRKRQVWYLSLGIATIGLGFILWGLYPSPEGGTESPVPAVSSVEK